MSKFINDILTGTTNKDFEIGRFLAALGVLAYIVYAGFHLFVNKTFNALEFGGGFGALLVGAGFGIAAKDRVHPDNIPRPAATIVEGDLNTTGSGDIKPGGA